MTVCYLLINGFRLISHCRLLLRQRVPVLPYLTPPNIAVFLFSSRCFPSLYRRIPDLHRRSAIFSSIGSSLSATSQSPHRHRVNVLQHSYATLSSPGSCSCWSSFSHHRIPVLQRLSVVSTSPDSCSASTVRLLIGFLFCIDDLSPSHRRVSVQISDFRSPPPNGFLSYNSCSPPNHCGIFVL